MRILDVKAKEIHVIMELPVTTIRSLLRCMDKCVVEQDMTDPENERAYKDFQEFYTFLDEFNKGIKDGSIE
jgi:hypothetical protein